MNSCASVVLGITKWQMVPASALEARESHIRGQFWKIMTEHGSEVQRADITPSSAWKLVETVLDCAYQVRTVANPTSHPTSRFQIRSEIAQFKQKITQPQSDIPRATQPVQEAAPSQSDALRTPQPVQKPENLPVTPLVQELAQSQPDTPQAPQSVQKEPEIHSVQQAIDPVSHIVRPTAEQILDLQAPSEAAQPLPADQPRSMATNAPLIL